MMVFECKKCRDCVHGEHKSGFLFSRDGLAKESGTDKTLFESRNTSDTEKSYFEMKNDNGKSRMDLLPFDALKGVSDVLTFGANKYTPNGWKDVPDAGPRYEAALLRHFAAIKTGEHNDPETGPPHIYHVACNALFLASLTGQESK